MKSILTLLLVALSLCGHAQTFTDHQDSAYQLLDKERITTGALANRAFPWVDLTIPQTSEDTLSYGYLAQAWQQLYLSTYARDNIRSMEEVHTLLRDGSQQIKLGYIAYSYHAIDTNALADGRLVMQEEDGLLRDGTGTPSPYNEFSLVAPIIFTEKLGAGTHSFYFDPELTLSNQEGTGIAAIKIVIGDQELTLAPGEAGELAIPSQEDGNEKIIAAIEMQLQDGQWMPYLYSFTDISVLARNFSQTTDECVSDPFLIHSGSALIFQGYDESTATQGVGEYKIFYHLQSLQGGPCDPHIRKPLILLDGFDPGNERPITSDANHEDGIWDLLSYGSNSHLGDELRLMGYDVIILNFPTYNVPGTGIPNRDGGADYIERNAMVLVKLIQEVKAQLAANGSTEKIVVVGPSMGGQISRYALAWMEQKYAQTADPQWQHHTRLWLSFDSPHLGANIPMSVQQGLVYLGHHLNQQKAADKYRIQLRSKAARQLLIEQMDGLNGSASFHQTYYNNLQTNGLSGSNGWPQNLRRIALTNGTNIGTKTGNAGAEAVYLKGEGPLGIKVFEMKLGNLPNNGGSGVTLEGLGADVGPTQVGFGSLSQTSTTTQVITNMSLKKTVKTGWIAIAPGIVPLFKKVTTTASEYTTTNNNTRGSLDVVQGGTYDSYDLLAEEVAAEVGNTSGVNNVTKTKTYSTHCFIPTLSALGSVNINYDWGVFFNKEYPLCSSSTPFHNFYIPGTNEEHVSLTQASADWVKYEIEEKKILPDEPLAICQVKTYSLNVTPPAGYYVQWSVSSELQIVSSVGSSITVRGTNPAANAWIKAEIKTSGIHCLVETVQKDLVVNDYIVDFHINPVTCLYYADVHPYNTNDSYWWSDDGILYSTFSTQTHVPYGTQGYMAQSGNNIPVYLTINTACGTQRNITTYFTVQSPPAHMTCPYRIASFDTKEELTLYPNPTSDKWQIVSHFDEDKVISYALYDATGKLLLHAEKIILPAYAGFEIQASHLAAGSYLLKADMEGGLSQRFNLIKQ